jgi:hypothetical protein
VEGGIAFKNPQPQDFSPIIEDVAYENPRLHLIGDFFQKMKMRKSHQAKDKK